MPSVRQVCKQYRRLQSYCRNGCSTQLPFRAKVGTRQRQQRAAHCTKSSSARMSHRSPHRHSARTGRGAAHCTKSSSARMSTVAAHLICTWKRRGRAVCSPGSSTCAHVRAGAASGTRLSGTLCPQPVSAAASQHACMHASHAERSGTVSEDSANVLPHHCPHATSREQGVRNMQCYSAHTASSQAAEASCAATEAALRSRPCT